MAGALLLKRPNPYGFPGGTPGVDTSHPAARNLLFSGIAQNGSFFNLMTGKYGVLTGAPPAFIDPVMGPSVKYGAGGASDCHTFPFPATAFTALTAAFFITMDQTEAYTPRVCSNNGSAASWGVVCGNATINYLSAYLGGNYPSQPPITLTTGVPFFCIVSYGPTGANFVTVNLRTGQTLHYTEAVISSPLAGDGNLYVGNYSAVTARAAGGHLSALMVSSHYMSIPEMLVWAQDPWSFWYP